MFNAFARELVLLVKNRLPPNQKATLKKRFRLFDLNSRKHVDAFIAARRVAPDAVFDGIAGAQIAEAVQDAEKPAADAYVAGMRIAAALVDDDAAEGVSARIARAIATRDTDSVRDIVCVDDELAQSLATTVVPAFEPPERLSDDLRAIWSAGDPSASKAAPGSGLGIVGLAQQISEDLDISELVTGGGGDASLSKIIQRINQKVQSRIQDGSLDAERLCAEAQTILGKMP